MDAAEKKTANKSSSESALTKTSAPASAAKRKTSAPVHKKQTPRARQVAAGDVPPQQTPQGIENFTVHNAERAAEEKKMAAITDILSNSPSEEALAMLKRLLRQQQLRFDEQHVNPDEELVADWRSGIYPYKNLMQRRNYERQKYRLQVELLKLQAWVKETGQKVVILFEGRDAAGKGGTIKRFMEHLNPRGARVVALEKPSEIERGQWYFQRYVQHLPTDGEIVLFDRSWYNRSGVERVMGFCSDQEYNEFVRQCPEFERMLVRNGI
ncbi:polyphosphate kinase 2, partial [Azonexus sp.]|uniref:polyphosphate kinase 2 n=1 Tax=Azonexus sp. TaxID=1872668 RepID=UPI0039E60FE4